MHKAGIRFDVRSLESKVTLILNSNKKIKEEQKILVVRCLCKRVIYFVLYYLILLVGAVTSQP